MRILKIAGIIGLVFGAPIEFRKRKTTTVAPTTIAETTFESPVILPIVDEDGSGDLIAAPMEIHPEQRGYVQNFIKEMQGLKDELKDVDWSSIKKKVFIA